MAPPYPEDHDLKKLESSLSENASIEVSYFLDEWFLKNTKTFLIIPDYLPLKEAVTLHFNKLEFPSPNDVSAHGQNHSPEQQFLYNLIGKIFNTILFENIVKLSYQGCL